MRLQEPVSSSAAGTQAGGWVSGWVGVQSQFSPVGLQWTCLCWVGYCQPSENVGNCWKFTTRSDYVGFLLQIIVFQTFKWEARVTCTADDFSLFHFARWAQSWWCSPLWACYNACHMQRHLEETPTKWAMLWKGFHSHFTFPFLQQLTKSSAQAVSGA